MSTKKINWLNTIFLTLCPLVGVVGLVLLACFSTISWQTWTLFGVFTALTGLSITTGYHRLFSHRTYKAAWPVRLFFLLLATAAFEGSVFEWCSDHRIHHRHADTEKDPYNINEGFWHAHMGWLIHLDTSKRDFSNIDDLTSDPLCRFQHRFFVPLSIIIGFGLPTLIASFWGAPLAGLVLGGALRTSVSHHFTFFINSLCHTLGKRPYSKEQTARDHWLAAIVTHGEGYHNFHHKFPLDYRNGVRLYHYDPTKWLIWLMSKCGLASDLKRISAHRIAEQAIKAQNQGMDTIKDDLFTKGKSQLNALLERIATLEGVYLQKLKDAAGRLSIKQCQKQLKQARRELKRALRMMAKQAA